MHDERPIGVLLRWAIECLERDGGKKSALTSRNLRAKLTIEDIQDGDDRRDTVIDVPITEQPSASSQSRPYLIPGVLLSGGEVYFRAVKTVWDLDIVILKRLFRIILLARHCMIAVDLR